MSRKSQSGQQAGRRLRTGNTADLDAARMVNNQMSSASKTRKQKLPARLLNHDLQAVEPRQIRKILAQDLKDARWRTIESAPNAAKGKRLFNAEYKDDRHTACGSKRGKKAVRFLTPGSRDIHSNVLPGCYLDPKGKKTGKGLSPRLLNILRQNIEK